MTLPTAEQVINLPDIETQWVVRATHHAETYFNIINSIDAKTFNLTKIDDEIYDDFMKTFPEVNLNDVDEDQLKSPEGKVKWREWIMKYENRVNDYNFGTLLRKNVKGDYTEDNTIFVPRMQFLAIEIARNKQGLNSHFFQNKAAHSENK